MLKCPEAYGEYSADGWNGSGSPPRDAPWHRGLLTRPGRELAEVTGLT